MESKNDEKKPYNNLILSALIITLTASEFVGLLNNFSIFKFFKGHSASWLHTVQVCGNQCDRYGWIGDRRARRQELEAKRFT